MEEMVYDPVKTPYAVDEHAFPLIGSLEEQFTFLLRYVILAPSTYNTQPWKFAVSSEGVEIYADYTRRIPVVDPGNRELLMSIGAAVMNFRIAAAHFGFAAYVSYNLSGDSEAPVAVVRLAPAEATSSVDTRRAALFPFIPRRHTYRGPYLVSRIPTAVLEQLGRLDIGRATSLIISTDGQINQQVGDYVAEANKMQLADAEYRRHLADWIRPNETQEADGITGAALGLQGPSAALTPWATKVLDLGRVRAAQDRNLCVEAPGLVIVLGEDTVPHWLDAGELLEELLLTAVQEGLYVSYFNMPIQIPDLRLKLRGLLRSSLWPQLLLRIGYSLREPVVTPRRSLDEVLLRPVHF